MIWKVKNRLIKKQDITDAVRRLISRYLSGKRGDTDINENKKLFDNIKRADYRELTYLMMIISIQNYLIFLKILEKLQI